MCVQVYTYIVQTHHPNKQCCHICIMYSVPPLFAHHAPTHTSFSFLPYMHTHVHIPYTHSPHTHFPSPPPHTHTHTHTHIHTHTAGKPSLRAEERDNSSGRHRSPPPDILQNTPNRAEDNSIWCDCGSHRQICHLDGRSNPRLLLPHGGKKSIIIITKIQIVI